MDPSLIVAVVIVVVFTLLCLATVFRFDVDGCIKVLSIFTGFFGLIFGAIGTYYFTRAEVRTARTELAENRSQFASYVATTTDAKNTLLNTLASKPSDYRVEDLKTDAQFKEAVKDLTPNAQMIWTNVPPSKTPQEKSY